jgi:hypothetical protein
MVGQAEGLPQITVLAVAVEHRLQERQEPAQLVATVALARPRLFLAVASLTLVAVVVELTTVERQVLVALVVAVPGRQTVQQRQHLEPQTQAVEAVAVEHRLMRLQRPAQAAPASSSSNTTSALPRSSPSSPRRSGLHLRVR